MTKNIKLNKILSYFLAIILILIYIVAACPIEVQNDSLYDIKCGELFVNEGIVKTDTFSIHDGLSYQSHHVVVTILLYYIYKIFGFLGLHIFEILLTIVFASLMYKLNYMTTKDKLFSYILVYIEIFMLRAFISLRAQMFSAIFFSIELILILMLSEENLSKVKEKIIYISLALLPMIIMNFHSGVYPFYYIIMGVYIVSSMILNNKKKAKDLILVSAISIPLMLINVYNVDGLTYVFKTLGNSFMECYISEYNPISVRSNPTFLVIIIIFAATFVFSKRKKTPEEVLFFAGTTLMALLSVRHFIFFIVCSPLYIKNLHEGYLNMFGNKKQMSKQTKITTACVIVTVYLVFLCFYTANKPFDYLHSETTYPKDAVNYIKENIDRDARILNSYNYGSYMLFEGIKVFVDARCDLYTKEYNDVTIAQDSMQFKDCEVYYMDIIEKYDIDYIFVEKDANVVEYLRHDSNMKFLYEDENSAIVKYEK